MTKIIPAPIELPDKLVPVFEGEASHRGAFGGRGSAKTRSFAKMTAVRGYVLAEARKSGVILCAREYMNSLEDSSLEEIKQAIRSEPWLDAYYDIGEKYIRTKNRRIHYVFAGLRHNLDSIKSKSHVYVTWVDEAESVSDAAWNRLEPTILRESESELWATWNPEDDESPTDKLWRKNPPEGAKIVELNYTDNPWFPVGLEKLRLRDLAVLDPATYAWKWEGAYLENSNAQIFANKYRVAEFTPKPDWNGPYQGLDWGFAQDPTAATRWWVHDNVLYLEREAVKTGLELDHTSEFICRRIDKFSEFTTRADNARPESISFVNRHGLPRVVACTKGKGSVEDGIAHMRSYREIVIHPRCTEGIREFRMYSHKVDSKSGDVLPDIVDAYNHVIDSGRYALEPLIKREGDYVSAKLRSAGQ